MAPSGAPTSLVSRMTVILESLGTEDRRKIAELREQETFFWVDMNADQVSPEVLIEVFDLHPDAIEPLLEFSPGAPPSQKFHTDGDEVVFELSCFSQPESTSPGSAGQPAPEIAVFDVHVCVHGQFILTVHREDESLPSVLKVKLPGGRSEQYIVYAVLDAMVTTAYDALSAVEEAMEDLEVMTTTMRSSRVRMTTLRAVSGQLAFMRRRIGPHRGIFERISEEIGRVAGLVSDSERYFERINAQLSRLVRAIDAAASSLAQLIDLRLNETMYRLTVIATIFLPLTFITGFFGMNFEWLVGGIKTPLAFILLGIGGPVLLAFGTWGLVQRRGSPVQPDPDAVQRLLGGLRRDRG